MLSGRSRRSRAAAEMVPAIRGDGQRSRWVVLRPVQPHSGHDAGGERTQGSHRDRVGRRRCPKQPSRASRAEQGQPHHQPGIAEP